MFRYKLTISYDGTLYHGWQYQPNGIAIQQKIEEALSIALREKTSITGASRTDAGVHAKGQVAHFSTLQLLDTYRLLASLNGLLPKDIRILSLESVPLTFHARYSAHSKIYHYHLHLDTVPNPFKRLYSTHIYFPIDLCLLRSAASRFIGTHDFSSFANEQHLGSAKQNPIRTLKRLEVVEEPGGVRLEFEAASFLYKMVRNITGTLLSICSSKLHIDDLAPIFAAKNRSLAGPAAPPQGLFLIAIQYPSTENLR